jgi:hypothetical protein
MQYPYRADQIIAFGANYRLDQASTTRLGSVLFSEDLYNHEEEQYLVRDMNLRKMAHAR